MSFRGAAFRPFYLRQADAEDEARTRNPLDVARALDLRAQTMYDQGNRSEGKRLEDQARDIRAEARRSMREAADASLEEARERQYAYLERMDRATTRLDEGVYMSLMLNADLAAQQGRAQDARLLRNQAFRLTEQVPAWVEPRGL